MYDTCTFKERKKYLRRLSALERKAEWYKQSSRGFLKRLTGFAVSWRRASKRKAQVPGGQAVPRLDRGTVREREDSYFSPCRIAVYTVLFGAYDELKEPWIRPDNIDYYVLTDQEVPEGSAWKKKDIPDCAQGFKLPGAKEAAETGFPETVLRNRFLKMFPHLIFPDYEISIYLDANIQVCSDLTALTAGLPPEHPSGFQPAQPQVCLPICMFRHKKRDCVHEEIKACIAQKKAPEGRLLKEGEALRQSGIPEHWGLLEAPVIVRRHRNEACRRLMETWWSEFLKGSGRDQPALIRALKKEGLTPDCIVPLGTNLRRCSLFVQTEHKKR